MRHPRTPADRVVWIGRLLGGEGRDGTVTTLSRTCGVSRQSLTTRREAGRPALPTRLTPSPAPVSRDDPMLARAVPTLLVAGHASSRGIQARVAELWGRQVRLGTTQALVAAAGRQARTCLETLAPAHPCALARAERFDGNARAAYLGAAAARDGVVWATAGPVPADAGSWTLWLWGRQERGGVGTLAAHDGGHAAAAGAAPCARDGWHVLARWGQPRHRLDVRVTEARAELAIRARDAAMAAAGRPWQGNRSPTRTATQAAVVAQETGWAEAVRGLGQAARRALEVVALRRDRVHDPAARRRQVEAAWALLAEPAPTVPRPVRTGLERRHAHTTQARPGLLSFAAIPAPAATAAAGMGGAAGVGVLGWAWQRRAVLDLGDDGVVAGVPVGWRQAARGRLHAWSSAVRTTSLAESWHALVRAHVAVQRGWPPGLLALPAVWHNHRVVARGRHAGTSPPRCGGLVDAPTDWLSALGSPPATDGGTLTPLPRGTAHPEEVAA